MGSDWLKSKIDEKTRKNVTKTTFFSFIFPILLSFTSRPSLSIVLCANQKLERKTCNTRVTLLWTILDAIFEMWGNLSFTRRMSSISWLKYTYFPLSIVYCFYSMYFIIGVIVKFLLQQRLQLSSTCCPVATWTSRTEAVVYVIKMRSLWFSDDSEYVIVEKSWARRVEAIDLFFIQK